MKELNGKPLIEYPCNWAYRVIGKDERKAYLAIEEVIQNQEYSVSPSNTSSKGNYISLHIEMEVHSEENRDSIFRTLKAHEDIIMVL